MNGRPRRAGFVLAGGMSVRMGRDKALLAYGGGTLVERVAREVERAAGSVTLVGREQPYPGVAYPVIPDLKPGLGPLGGIHTALRHSTAEWNLITACDMPALKAEFLETLLVAAERSGRRCLVPHSPRGLEPLCSVYHVSAGVEIAALLRAGERKMMRALEALDPAILEVETAAPFTNVNTPADWNEAVRRHE